MENVHEKLKDILSFIDKAEDRAYDLINAKGCSIKLRRSADKYDISETNIEFTFEEDTRHDCPDYLSITLSLEQLSMSDEDWKLLIDNMNAVREENNKKSAEKAIEDQRRRKEEEFERLKQELGK